MTKIEIDIDDREQIERLSSALTKAAGWSGSMKEWRTDCLQAALREFANPTVKPEEPQGVGAVVEDDAGYLWVRVPKDGNCVQTEWVSSHSTCQFWDSISVVLVLSEGVVAP